MGAGETFGTHQVTSNVKYPLRRYQGYSQYHAVRLETAFTPLLGRKLHQLYCAVVIVQSGTTVGTPIIWYKEGLKRSEVF